MVKKKQLRGKDVAEDIANYGIVLHKKDVVELYDDILIVINKEPLFFYYGGKLYPTLKFLLKNTKSESSLLKIVVIDMGAVKYMMNGADVMRPGIIAIDVDIIKGEAVVVVDELHKKPLAVGIALVGAVEMEQLKHGRVITTVHYVSDSIWLLQ